MLVVHIMRRTPAHWTPVRPLTDDNTPGYIAARESRFWEDAVNDIYTIASQNPETVDPEMIWDIQQLIGRLISKASQLLGRFS